VLSVFEAAVLSVFEAAVFEAAAGISSVKELKLTHSPLKATVLYGSLRITVASELWTSCCLRAPS
jgi:hypothetical protein